MKKSVNKNKKIKISTKRNVVVGIVLILVIAPFAIYGYNKWLDARDYQRFMTIRADIEALAGELDDAGSNKTATTHKCNLPGVKFQKADYRCSSSVQLSTDVKSSDEVMNKIDKYVEVVNEQDAFIRRESSRSPYPDMSLGLEIDTYELFIEHGRLSVSGEVELKYVDDDIACSMYSNIESSMLIVTIECGAQARAKHF